MVTRACISINNKCNLRCTYCHFHEKKEHIHDEKMDVIKILDNITHYIDIYNPSVFKLGFVGNGEPLLSYLELKEYIMHIQNYITEGKIAVYTITNGLLIDREKLEFFKKYKINVGFSIDGIPQIHDKYRCNTHRRVMEKIELFKDVFGQYPAMNCTVGSEVIDASDAVISFFEQFDSRITFSRMIGKYGVSYSEYSDFLQKASKRLNVRTGGYDCTMYGGMCGAGMNNIFYANGRVYLCGNCIDLSYSMSAYTPIDEIHFDVGEFDRHCCFKELINR